MPGPKTPSKDTKRRSPVKVRQAPAQQGMKTIVPLNFRVPAEFKRAFKVAAASHSITQSVLLQQAFEAWKKTGG